jgi:phospholipid/cholesterol/gamma-HCH transport system substrate-binding protein
MKNILSRVDHGEGLLGELTTTPETKQRMTDTFMATLNKTNAILSHVESGKGLLGRMVYDDKYGEQLTASLASSAESLRVVANSVQRSFESGQGALPALLNDPEGKKRVYELVDNLRITSANLATFSTAAQNGQGLVPRLFNDKAYADQAMLQFSQLVGQLNLAVQKLNTGEGTAGKLISDPSVYESINDILIGINESKMLRWLIRNRQEKGIEKRVNTEQKPPPPPPTTKSEAAPEAPPVTASATDGKTSTSPPPL